MKVYQQYYMLAFILTDVFINAPEISKPNSTSSECGSLIKETLQVEILEILDMHDRLN